MKSRPQGYGVTMATRFDFRSTSVLSATIDNFHVKALGFLSPILSRGRDEEGPGLALRELRDDAFLD